MTYPFAPWMKLSMDAMLLGAEAQTVIGLRLMKLAAGGAAAAAEAELMVTEKVSAAMEVNRHLAVAALTGGGPRGASRAMAHYRRKVRANRRRLSAG